MNKRERLLEIADKINITRRELTRLESEFDKVAAEPSGDAPVLPVITQSDVNPVADAVINGPMTERIFALMDMNPAHDFTALELAKGIRADKVASVRTAINRLQHAKRIETVKPGVYRILQGKGS